MIAVSIPEQAAGPASRHRTTGVRVGHVMVGGGAPIVVQSMTNTDTADVEATVVQVAALARARLEIVRITVDRTKRRRRFRTSANGWIGLGVAVRSWRLPLHRPTVLAEHPACAEALDKYRINPGNVGFKEKKDRQFGAIVGAGDPARQGRCGIGANWGSLDQGTAHPI
jgi:(E)-4-hydroxy-3-methylbut-2-enyl-diphosphate synthase